MDHRKRNQEEIVRHNLKLLRIKCGFTQDHLAEVLYCSRSAYSYKENGKTGLSISELVTLGRLYNISIASFLEPIKELKTSAKRPNKGINPHRSPERISELTMDERRFIALYRTFDPLNKMVQMEQQI